MSLDVITNCIVASIVALDTSRLFIHLADNVSTDTPFFYTVNKDPMERPKLLRFNQPFREIENVYIFRSGLNSFKNAHTSES